MIHDRYSHASMETSRLMAKRVCHIFMKAQTPKQRIVRKGNKEDKRSLLFDVEDCTTKEKSTSIAPTSEHIVSLQSAGTMTEADYGAVDNSEDYALLQRDSLEHLVFRLQNAAIITAHLLALAAMAIVIWWVVLLGGLSTKPGKAKLIFNWHPLLMISAFCFMTVMGIFAFRSRFVTCRRTAKILHGTGWGVAALCATLGLIAVFKSHNDGESGFIANLYSFHSWVGMSVVAIYSLQFLAGFFTFGFVPFRLTNQFKANVLTLHYFVGPILYYATAVTILLGIQEKEGFVGCSYKVSKADLFPIEHFYDIPLACRVSHTLGLVVIAMAVCTSIAFHDFTRGRIQNRVGASA